MKAEIALHGETLNRVIPCDHDDRDECTKPYTITLNGVEHTNFCEALIHAQVRLEFRLNGSSISVRVDEGEHWFALSRDQVVELDAFIDILRHTQLRGTA